MKEPNLVRTLILAAGLLLHFGPLCFQINGATNDAFSNAQILSGASGTTIGDNIGATKQSGEPDHADNSGGSSVWFRWTAPGTGQFSFSTSGSDFDTLLAVYTGNNVNNLNPVASNDDANFDLTSAVSILATSGTTYRVAIDGFDGETGALVLNWSPEVPPANDNFTNAQVISGTTGSAAGSNVGATRETGEPDHAGVAGGRSVWFQWTAPSTNAVSMTTAGSDFDTTLAVYAGTSVNALVEVASNDEFEADSTSAVTFIPSAGTMYRIAVDGYSGQMGAVMLNWAPFDNGAEAALAVTFSALRHFTNDINGFWPEAPVIGFGNRLYGTTITHNPGAGTIFALNPDGTGFTLLKTLNGGVADGANPESPLIAFGDTLYGTLSAGGAGFRGAVFAIKTNGTGFILLHSFTTSSGPLLTNADGAGPRAGLVLAGDTLYGTGFGTLRQFNGTDGLFPQALILSGNFLYGTTFKTLFAMNTTGTGFTNLASFVAPGRGTPHGPIVLSGDRIYGSTSGGGAADQGTIYSVRTNGTGYVILHQFPLRSGLSSTNSDGAIPRGISLFGNGLYGAAQVGGYWGYGTVFRLSFPLPVLAIVPDGTNVLLKWPASPGGFYVQTATNLGSPADWITHSSVPEIVNGRNTVTNPATGTQMFFRLKSQ